MASAELEKKERWNEPKILGKCEISQKWSRTCKTSSRFSSCRAKRTIDFPHALGKEDNL